MANVGIVTHQTRNTAAEHTGEMARWLLAEGHTVCIPASDAADTKIEGAVVDDAHFGDGLAALISMGGDGSILRAVDLLDGSDVPIVGVNYGELGYLAAVEPAEAHAAVTQVLAGTATVEERMMVQADVFIDGQRNEFHALNDIVVERGATSTTIRVDVRIDEAPFHTYAADGIIVASPTGSTAYSLSARGPVLAADHQALLLTPVSPHQLFDRSMVLSPTSVVELTVVGHRDAKLAVDGRTIMSLSEGESVRVTVSPRTAKLVTVGRRQFHEVLKSKFGL